MTDDLVKRLTKKFDDLDFSAAQVDGFISDIVKGGDGFVSAIGKIEELVGSWRILFRDGDAGSELVRQQDSVRSQSSVAQEHLLPCLGR